MRPPSARARASEREGGDHAVQPEQQAKRGKGERAGPEPVDVGAMTNNSLVEEDDHHRGGDDQAIALICPSCGMRLLPPLDDPLAMLIECPACETRFEVEEGMPRLHGDRDLDPEPD